MLRAQKVTVVRDETTRVTKEVWEHELPILEAKHPAGFVIREGEAIEYDEREPPDPAEEYARLDRVYGTDDSQRPLAELVYGYGPKGVDDLEKRIKQASKKMTKKAKDELAKIAKSEPDDPFEE